MSEMTLYIGNKSLSSWSLRPWLLMKQYNIEFEEHLIRLDEPESRGKIIQYSPTGKVPALVHGGQTVWDSLSISEYLNDLYPEKKMWPEQRNARAVARSISAEMHSGFSALREQWPMNYSRNAMSHLVSLSVKHDITRIIDIWSMCRKHFKNDGPFLFGKFSIADAMYAPVVSRFRTYGPLDLNEDVTAYCQSVWTLPAMREWGEGAKLELLRVRFKTNI